MEYQPSLFEFSPTTSRISCDADLTCYYGTPWDAHFNGSQCTSCDAAVADSLRRFDDGVRDGRWDAQGYTPRDRGNQERKRRKGSTE